MLFLFYFADCMRQIKQLTSTGTLFVEAFWLVNCMRQLTPDGGAGVHFGVDRGALGLGLQIETV